jgi:two-component system CheB/CheR fusion protein
MKETIWPPEMGSFDEDVLRSILAHLRVRTGHDFSKYKRSTVMRRLARRMQVNRVDTLKEYHEVIRNNGDEVQALLADLLISVTSFFRDEEAFETLEKRLPDIFATKTGQRIRVWVAGCATGEEAYSVGILLLEEASRHPTRSHIQVFGTDLDVRALARARDGRYPVAIEADVSETRLRRYFTREGDYYRVRQELRDILLFSVHDLLKDPPFSHLDLISCRNVLIYLDRDLQDQVCSAFHCTTLWGVLVPWSGRDRRQPAGAFPHPWPTQPHLPVNPCARRKTSAVPTATWSNARARTDVASGSDR